MNWIVKLLLDFFYNKIMVLIKDLIKKAQLKKKVENKNQAVIDQIKEAKTKEEIDEAAKKLINS